MGSLGFMKGLMNSRFCGGEGEGRREGGGEGGGEEGGERGEEEKGRW